MWYTSPMRLNDVSQHLSAAQAVTGRQQEPGGLDSPLAQHATQRVPSSDDARLENALQVTSERSQQAADGLQRASEARELVNSASDQIRELRSALDTVNQQAVDAEELELANQRFTQSLSQLATIDGRIQDQAEGSTAFDPQTLGSLALESLGTMEAREDNQSLTSLASLRDTDLSALSPEQRETVEGMLADAQARISSADQAAERQINAFQQQQDLFGSVLGVLQGAEQGEDLNSMASAIEDDPQLQQQARAVQNMLQQLSSQGGNEFLAPGSLINLPA
ncbi:MAG: hypothetical protein EA401_02640 [Planctomycetota bacterium]|nr:MAG: hypothetical protein EA401_02640 [Planctomycetota bacterium]